MESFQVWLQDHSATWSPITLWFHQHITALIMILAIGIFAYYAGAKLLRLMVRRMVRTNHHKHWHSKDIEKRQKTLSIVVTNVWHIFIVFVVCVALFKEAFKDADAILTPLFASAGIIGVALGFGAQSLVKDFLTGMFIIGENQYRVGDIVTLGDATGTVESIGNRTTVIRDIDGNVHYLPNGTISHVINKTMGYSMARFIITISPTSDVKKVSIIIDRIGKHLASEDKWKSKIIDPPAFVSVGDFSGKSLEIIIAGKTQPSDQWAVVAEMRQRLLDEFEKQDIELAD